MKINFIEYILFQLLFLKIFCNNYCRFGESCLYKCKNCGEDNNYSECNYYNLFCETNSGITYFDEYENKYIDYFSNNNDLNNICGNQILTIDTKKNKYNFEILKINNESTTQQFLKNQKIHCYYEFENNFYKDINKNISLIIEHQNSENINSSDTNKINFNIIIMLYSQSTSANIFDLNKNSLNNSIDLIELKYYTAFALFIDIDSNENIKESITISLNFENNKKLSPIYILLIILAALILLILIILLISIIKSKLRKNQRQNNSGNNDTLSAEEQEKKVKMKKITQLFATEFIPQYYSKDLDEKGFNACTICLKKFKNNTSKILIISCNHIFHYKCLYDWLITNNHWKCPICNLDLTENVKLIPNSNKNSQDQINLQKLNLNHGITTQTSNELFSLNVNTNN